MEQIMSYCQRCGKNTNCYKFETVPQILCVNCFKKIIKKRIAKNFVKSPKIYVLSLDDFYFYNQYIDFAISITYSRSVNCITLNDLKNILNSSDERKTKEIVLPLPNNVKDVLFLYSLFYEPSCFKTLSFLNLFSNPFNEISFEEIEVINTVFNTMLDTNLLDFIAFLEHMNLISCEIDKGKLCKLYDHLVELTKQYRGVLQSLQRSVDLFFEIKLL